MPIYQIAEMKKTNPDLNAATNTRDKDEKLWHENLRDFRDTNRKNGNYKGRIEERAQNGAHRTRCSSGLRRRGGRRRCD